MAGRYTTTYNAVDCGILEDGAELQQDAAYEMINKSDAYGDALIDLVYRGGNVSMMFQSLAYKAGSQTPFWPWGSMGVMATTAAPIGRLGSAVAKAALLTAVANTPAAAAPATLTATLSILSPNANLKLLFSSRLRKVPIRLLVLPGESAGTVTWFATT